jgi:hypothetical protein
MGPSGCGCCLHSSGAGAGAAVFPSKSSRAALNTPLLGTRIWAIVRFKRFDGHSPSRAVCAGYAESLVARVELRLRLPPADQGRLPPPFRAVLHLRPMTAPSVSLSDICLSVGRCVDAAMGGCAPAVRVLGRAAGDPAADAKRIVLGPPVRHPRRPNPRCGRPLDPPPPSRQRAAQARLALLVCVLHLICVLRGGRGGQQQSRFSSMPMHSAARACARCEWQAPHFDATSAGCKQAAAVGAASPGLGQAPAIRGRAKARGPGPCGRTAGGRRRRRTTARGRPGPRPAGRGAVAGSGPAAGRRRAWRSQGRRSQGGSGGARAPGGAAAAPAAVLRAAAGVSVCLSVARWVQELDVGEMSSL